MKQKIIKFIKKFLEIDELEGQLTQIDNELVENVNEVAGMRIDVDDRPTYYDMESYVDDQINDNMSDIIERVEALENAWYIKQLPVLS